MIEIRPAHMDEVPRQKELWKLAFGDNDAYINYFYAHRNPTEDTLVLLEDGVLNTMMALFPITIALPDGGKATSSYIYALATHPNARKKGFGRFILSYADFYLKEQGLDCVTILPAEASLHRFFSTTGFDECFSARKMELMQYMTKELAPDDRLQEIAPADYNTLRETLLAGTFHVSYGDDLLDYQQGLSKMSNGGLYRLTVAGVEGCAVAEYTDEDSVLIKELLLPSEQLAGAMALLAAKLPAVRYHLRTPPFWDGLTGGYLQSYSMMKWYHKDLELLWRQQTKGYMGLAFD